MPSISMVTFAGQTVTPQDDSLVYESALGDGGIIYGAQVTLKNANTLHIASGHGIIAGRKFTVYESDIPIVLSSAGVLLGRLYIHMDLSNASDPIEILTETGNSLSPLIQDEDVNIVNGVFEFNLATFNVSTSTIGDLRNVYPRVQYANSGSFIYVTASNPSLIGQEVQITDGTDTIYAIFDANGVAELRNVFMTGTLQLTATDGTYTAGATLNVPYYGTYNVTMAFWLATLSITTTSPEFYNQQITIRDSDDEVVGTTTFNSVGAASFIVSAPDTYTLSIVSGGNTYTATVTVTSQTTYEVSLNAGFQWADWVTSGGLNPESYGSLADVLVDEAALRRLFLVHDSVDYMAEISNSDNAVETIVNTDLAAKWINLSDYALDALYANTIIAGYMDTADKYFYGEWVITDDTTTPPTWGAKGNVPVMTSDTAPYGTASASSVKSGSGAAYTVFDGDDSTSWMANGLTGSIGYTFTNPVCVRRISVNPRMGGSPEYPQIKTCKLQGSNDGSTWIDIGTFIAEDESGWQTFDFDNDNYYLNYQIYGTGDAYGSIANMGIINLQFYGRELSVSVPNMTSNTTPYGEAGGSNFSSSQPYLAFDNNSSTKGVMYATVSGTQSRIQYKFANPICVKAFDFVGNLETPYLPPTAVQLQGSNDGTNWENIGDKKTNISADANKKSYTVNNDKYYLYISLLCDMRFYSGNNAYYAQFSSLQFYGLDYSEKEFEEGTTKKWLYDHGVELETIVISGTGTKGTDAIQLTAANAQAVATIDTTDYSLMRGKVGSHASGTNQLICGSGASNFTASNMPNNNGFDVSSVNGSNAVGVKQTAVGIFDATEFWLE